VFPRKKCFPCDDTNLFILLYSLCPFVFGERESESARLEATESHI
jgi:hypothetical protein